MSSIQIGDIVARKSYGEDINFRVVGIHDKDSQNPVYVLRGMFLRIEVDSKAEDIVVKDSREAYLGYQRQIIKAKNNNRSVSSVRLPIYFRLRQRPGTILHIDSSERFLNLCREQYREAGIRSVGIVAAENEQPGMVRRALYQSRPDILIVTGHDGYKKEGGIHNLQSYRNSRYYIECVKEARRYQPDHGKLCIFAGACQSYFEGIMAAGADFGSSPGRVNINALDPAIVCQKVSLTDERQYVIPEEVVRLTISGRDGIGGIKTKGKLRMY